MTEKSNKIDDVFRLSDEERAAAASLNSQTQQYKGAYSESEFWSKLKSVGKRLGLEGVEKLLWLLYALLSDKTPVWAKGTIVGALGYFIFPVDAIPDFIPFVGYADDMGVVGTAVATVAFYIDADVKAKTREKMQQWFSKDKP